MIYIAGVGAVTAALFLAALHSVTGIPAELHPDATTPPGNAPREHRDTAMPAHPHQVNDDAAGGEGPAAATTARWCGEPQNRVARPVR
ncbi:hypothetical protein ACIP10_34935 [Streptomyces galbus]|uniref:hypothetical protein n=1 Tax=Streptomyces galbus TaxID=33898 RepID=UPI00382A67D5